MADLASIWAGTQAAISLFGALKGKKGDDTKDGFLKLPQVVPTYGLSQKIKGMGLAQYYPTGERITSSESAARFGGLQSKRFGTSMEQLYEPRNKTMQNGLNLLANQLVYNAIKTSNRVSLGHRIGTPEADWSVPQTIKLG